MVKQSKVLIKQEKDQEIVDYLSRVMSISRQLAGFLVNRGIFSPREAGFFLFGDLCDLPSPFELKDMEKAITRIIKALKNKEKIMIYGDYDADGITSTALLTIFLRNEGGQIYPFLPRREKEGYGLDGEALEKAARDGIKLLITVDCGSKNTEEVSLGRSLGMDIIITDHHQIEELPPANAVINPHRKDNEYPFPELAGVGVVFKLCQAILGKISSPKDYCSPFLRKLLPLVAVGTVADLVPLREENRVLVKEGLREMENTSIVGLKALMEKTGIENSVNSGNIAFGIAPRLNAAGRLKTANIALELLITDDKKKAKRLSAVLNRLNRRRQKVEGQIVEEARGQFYARKNDLILVGASENWNPGVVGIAASKLVEEFSRPVLLIGLEGSTGKGSGRSISGFDLYKAMKNSEDCLVKFGGHPMAAGFSIKSEKVEELNKKINGYARENLSEELLRKKITIEEIVELEQANLELVSDIEKLAPFGVGNPRPLFSVEGLKIKDKRLVGRDGKHLQLKLVGKNKEFTRNAVAFKMGELFSTLKKGPGYQVVFAPKTNEWNGKKEIQLEIKDIAPSYISEIKGKKEGKKLTFSLLISGNLQLGREKALEQIAGEIKERNSNGIYIAPTLNRLVRAWEKRPKSINCGLISGFKKEILIKKAFEKLKKEEPYLLFISFPLFFYYFKNLAFLPLILGWESPYPDFSPPVFYNFLRNKMTCWDKVFGLELRDCEIGLPFNPQKVIDLGGLEIEFEEYCSSEILASLPLPLCVFSNQLRRKLFKEKIKGEIISPIQAISEGFENIAVFDFPATGGEFLSFLEAWKGQKLFYNKNAQTAPPKSPQIDRDELVQLFLRIMGNKGPVNLAEIRQGNPGIWKEGLKIFEELDLVKNDVENKKIWVKTNKTGGRNVDLFRSLRYNEFVNEREAYLRWSKILAESLSRFINSLGGGKDEIKKFC